ncbi:DUF2599 domain-containing protein [Actinopolymorpha sp. B9G3]|uniref:DUF2599 domain-containing protein n=1 Tax=Actinopolymorpha sp. B9G3 TaxID=3158970 RepID=UPI0032D8E463
MRRLLRGTHRRPAKARAERRSGTRGLPERKTPLGARMPAPLLPRRLLVRALALVAMVGSLLVASNITSTASASTSFGYVGDGSDVLGEGWFYSGNDGEHGRTGGAGFNSFILLDLDCDDGLTIGVTWRVGRANGVREIPKDKCGDDYGFTIDRQTSKITEMSWRLWAKDSDGEIQYSGRSEKDWLGSLSDDKDDRIFFEKTSVYNDEYHGDLGITASVWPTQETNDTDIFAGLALKLMSAELNARTPLPEHFSDDQRESIYKQLVCHAQGKYFAEPDQIGDSWDLESWRPNISWAEVWGGAKEHECNWSSEGGYDGYIPPVDRPDNQPPVVNAGPDVDGHEGADVKLRGEAVDELGEPPVHWTYEPMDGVDAGAKCRFADKSDPVTTVRCTDDGTYRLTLTADDGVNAPVSDSAVLTVRNVAPTLRLKAPENWAVYRVEDRIELDAPFTDPGSNDTHTCSISWDDGTTSTFAAEDHTCSRGRTFDHAGMYTMEMTVTDDDGGADSAEVMVVVYDPRAGLLTGAGKVDDHTIFATVAKYLTTDSTKPFGTFTLSAPASGDERLTFTTTTLEWLVITPDAKSAVKGTAGEYGFVAYATDARFRAVVWPLSAGTIPPDDLLYDTSPDAGFDVDVAEPRALTTGATVIDGGWVPGAPLPLGDALDGVLPGAELTATGAQDCLLCVE